MLGASVGALSSRYDAAALGADRAGLFRARRDYFGVWFLSAAAARLLWSASGPKGPRRRLRRPGSRLTPGRGQVMPRARRLLGVLQAARLATFRRASLSRRARGAASSVNATPCVAPGPAHAGS